MSLTPRCGLCGLPRPVLTVRVQSADWPLIPGGGRATRLVRVCVRCINTICEAVIADAAEQITGDAQRHLEQRQGGSQ